MSRLLPEQLAILRWPSSAKPRTLLQLRPGRPREKQAQKLLMKAQREKHSLHLLSALIGAAVLRYLMKSSLVWPEETMRARDEKETKKKRCCLWGRSILPTADW